jgi:Tol biopolymer transport system component
MRTTVPLLFALVMGLLVALLWRVQGRVPGQVAHPPRATLASSSVLPRAARFDPAMRNVRMLTLRLPGSSWWDNAEAYFSPDARSLVFQSTRDSAGCDVIYTMGVDGSSLRRVSSGRGRTTCSFYSPDGAWIVYASTHLAGDECPPAPSQSLGYSWAVYDTYEIFKLPVGGGNPVRLTESVGYDAECVFSPDGSRILFTSDRDGDLDLYTMAADGGDVRRVTNIPGYDGGGFFTADGEHIVFRARHPEGDELAEYQRLLAEHVIRPSRLDLYMVDVDGTNLRRLTTDGDRGATSWAPYPHPDGLRIAFASNRGDYDRTLPGRFGFDFDLYLLDLRDQSVRRLTFNPSFDGFPMFSSDGRRLVWCGNYVPERERDTDVLICDWQEAP